MPSLQLNRLVIPSILLPPPLRGEADIISAGGSEACVIPFGLVGFIACRALSQRNGEPAKASRPWDKGRDGFVMGEGAGTLVRASLRRGGGTGMMGAR